MSPEIPRRRGSRVDRAPTTSQTLRSHTRDAHLAVEAALDVAQVRTDAALADLLAGWLEVWRAVLRAASVPSACPAAVAELRYPAAQAVAWLRSDLTFLTGGSIDQEHRAPPELACRELDDLLRNLEPAWGVAYVLRGSRLGGTVLAPALREALGLRTAQGTNFLASTGTDTGLEWVAFRRRMDAIAMTPSGLATAVEAASWTFGWVGARTSDKICHRLVIAT